MVEVLHPDTSVPLDVAAPWVCRLWRNEVRYETQVQFEDGGVWGIDDRRIAEARDVKSMQDFAVLFARNPTAFRFIKRNRARYARRM